MLTVSASQYWTALSFNCPTEMAGGMPPEFPRGMLIGASAVASAISGRTFSWGFLVLGFGLSQLAYIYIYVSMYICIYVYIQLIGRCCVVFVELFACPPQ